MCMYNITLKSFNVTTVAMEKHQIFWVCMCVTLVIQHAMPMRHNAICHLSGCKVIFYIISYEYIAKLSLKNYWT